MSILANLILFDKQDFVCDPKCPKCLSNLQNTMCTKIKCKNFIYYNCENNHRFSSCKQCLDFTCIDSCWARFSHNRKHCRHNLEI